MQNLFLINLRATNPDFNVDRDYCISLGQDLFAQWYVTLHYGRHKTQGVSKTIVFNTQEEACLYAESRLKKRAKARKRINCDYQLTKLRTCPKFETSFNSQTIEPFYK